jgi:hypothetical protein
MGGGNSNQRRAVISIIHFFSGRTGFPAGRRLARPSGERQSPVQPGGPVRRELGPRAGDQSHQHLSPMGVLGGGHG